MNLLSTYTTDSIITIFYIFLPAYIFFFIFFFFFNDTAPTEIYTLSLHDALPICGIEGCTGHPHYSAAKAGILGFTRSVAKELIVQGIRVNAVAPGFIDTRRLKGSLGAGRQAELARTPAGRLGTPEEVAATVAFLASDDAAYFVGAT